MKAESAAYRLMEVFWGGLIVLLLFSCSGKPISAQLPKAQNDDTLWQGKTLREWRWDLREFKDTQKCARASSALARAECVNRFETPDSRN